ncbi:MAG: flagellar protein FlgN [Desulfobacteraceae bacterium]|nr:flagellar protein FlgN [Desulfobacteraceae bacterium]
METMPTGPELECIDTARELQTILEREKDVLRRFDGNELLMLIPHKEFLLSELNSKLHFLDGAHVSVALKDLLAGIEELNSNNGLFIRRSLSYWQDLLSIFAPPSYGPGGTGASMAPRSRGLTFSREI